jgi:uncharacterized protein YndB with AHSA1/START domain
MEETIMTEKKGAPAQTPRETVVLERVFDAPRSVVFKMWIDPRHMAQWWGPKGFTNPVCEIDARPGGSIKIIMRSPEGTEHGVIGVFREVVEPERLAFTNIAVDQDGNHLLEGFTTVTFADEGGSRTRMILETSATGVAPQAPEMLKGMNEGWSQSLERLEALCAIHARA